MRTIEIFCLPKPGIIVPKHRMKHQLEVPFLAHSCYTHTLTACPKAVIENINLLLLFESLCSSRAYCAARHKPDVATITTDQIK